VLRRMHTPSDGPRFAPPRISGSAKYLVESGHADRRAKILRRSQAACVPESWNYKRQGVGAQKAPMEGGAVRSFWAAVDALGDGKYYPTSDDI